MRPYIRPVPPDVQHSGAEPPILPVLKRFLPYLWPKDAPGLRWRLALSGALVPLAKGGALLVPFAYKAVVDRMSGDTQAALPIILLLVGAYILARFTGTAFDSLRRVAFERVGQTATHRLASRTFAHLHKLSLRYHLSRRTGEITKVVERGTKTIDTMIYFLLFNIAPTVVELAVVLVVFYLKLGIGSVIATAFMVWLYIWFTRKVTDWRNHLRQEMNDLDTRAIGRSVDSLLNYETVKYFGAEKRETDRYSHAVQSYARAAEKSENSLGLLNIGQSFITNAMMLGAMLYTVWLWSRGDLTVGDLVLVNGLLMQLFRPLDLLGMVYRMIRQGLIDMAAMFDLMDTEPEIIDDPDAPPLAIDHGAVTFENVRFAYNDDRQILHGISFTVPAGKTLAIVGPSGAGKSTIGRLLFRFYDPQSGRILIDGQDIAHVTQESLRQGIGIVPQDTVLFNDTIGYNIAYGKQGASGQEVREAAAGAAIDGFVESLPQSYDTQVGERGLKLSGGEKQRVAIARPLLKTPPILILDEATSALDSRTEDAIQDTLDRIARRRTTLIVAHRLSTVTHADEIIVLDQGRIVERGSHAALLDKGTLYADMWRRQAEEREVAEAAE